MNCPVCHEVRMREVEKNEVLIDICPNCKGVWLDRGELEKLMRDVREVREQYNRWYYDDDDHRDYGKRREDDDDKHRRSYDHYPKHKKKSVLDRLGDLFD